MFVGLDSPIPDTYQHYVHMISLEGLLTLFTLKTQGP